MKTRNIWFFWIGIFVFLIGLLWLLKIQIEKQVAIKLPQWVWQASKGKYHATISHIKFNIFPLGVQIENAVLEPEHEANAKKLVVGLRAKTIRLTGFKLLDYLQKKHLCFSKLETQDLQIKIGSSQKIQKKPQKDTSQSSIKFFSIDKVRLGPVQLAWQSKTPLSLKNLYISLDSLRFEQGQSLHIGHYLVKLDSLNYHLNDKLHRATIDKLKIDKNKGLQIQNLCISPLIRNESDFFRLAATQTDRFEVKNMDIEADVPDLDSLFENQTIVLDQIGLSKAYMHISRDKRYISAPHPTPLLPMQALKKIALGLQINRFIAGVPLVEYKEFDKKSPQAGTLKFENVWLEFDSLNTKNKAGKFLVKAGGRVQGRAKLNLTLDFDYQKPNFFRCQGSVLHPFQASIFNSAAYPLAGIRLSDGEVFYIDFDFGATSTHAKGRLNLQYQNLKIQLAPNTLPVLSSGIHKVISNLADDLIFKPANPMKGEKIRIANINNPRTNNSFINYLWKSLLSGIKDAVDLPEIIKNKKAKKGK